MEIGNIRNPPKSLPAWCDWNLVRVDRSTVLGNPFRIGPDGTREEVIEKYRDWLPKAYAENPGVKLVIDRLVDHEIHSEHPTVLLCWCDPKPCHAGVIRDFVLAIVNEIARDQQEAYDQSGDKK